MLFVDAIDPNLTPLFLISYVIMLESFLDNSNMVYYIATDGENYRKLMVYLHDTYITTSSAIMVPTKKHVHSAITSYLAIA